MNKFRNIFVCADEPSKFRVVPQGELAGFCLLATGSQSRANSSMDVSELLNEFSADVREASATLSVWLTDCRLVKWLRAAVFASVIKRSR